MEALLVLLLLLLIVCLVIWRLFNSRQTASEFDRMAQAIDDCKTQVGLALLPVFEQFLDSVANWLESEQE